MTGIMRTTIEISAEHRARLLELAARRGEKGFSAVVAEAIEAHLQSEEARRERRRRAAALRGGLSRREAEDFRRRVSELRASWR